MSDNTFAVPTIEAPAVERSAFLRRVAAWTLGGLAITTVVSLVSMAVIVPFVARGGTIAILGVVYGSFLLSQTVARKMVYGESKVAGFVLGASAQGISLGFILLFTLVASGVGEGLTIISYALGLTLSAVVGMLAYVSMEKREFSMLRAGLSMLFIPMLLLMGLQLVFPIDGTLGLLFAGLFVAVSVGAMLWKLNEIVHVMPTSMGLEAGYETSLGIVVLFWNILSLLSRAKRR
jgi:FtsH-binding integral membrane protein